jgi:hypothetical protein
MRAVKCLAIIATLICGILIPFVGFDAFTWFVGSLFVACMASGLDR